MIRKIINAIFKKTLYNLELMTYRCLLIIVAFLFACSNSRENKDSELIDEMMDMNIRPQVGDSAINNILQQIPSPLEMSALVKKSGARYNKSYLNNPESYSKYNNSFERALNLGIFGADLGYSNLYEENQQCILYVGAIKELADELRIDQFFNFRLIERLADQRNLDSLLLISTQSYNEVNAYFQEQQRQGLSVLLLVGGWLEALHISAEVSSSNSDNTSLIEKIGEQKIVLDGIIELLGYFKEGDENYAKLSQELIDLRKIYDSVNIEHEYNQPTYEEVNGELISKDNSKSTVHIDNETFMTIKNKVQEIRSGIIS